MFAEGDEGDKFYLVAQGAVDLNREGKPLAEAGPGGYLGEGALLDAGRRSATAQASCDETLLYSLSRDSFRQLTSRHPTVRDEVQRTHSRRTQVRSVEPN